MFTRKPNAPEGEAGSEETKPAPRTQTPMPTEDLIAKRPRPDIPRPRVAQPEAREPQKKQEGSRLLVGDGIVLKGEISNCAELVVEGTVDARVEATHFKVGESGKFNGEVNVETSDIAGNFEGVLNCRGRLNVRGTGRLKGTLRYGEVEIEAGGRIAGEVQVFGEEEPARVETPEKRAAAVAGE